MTATIVRVPRVVRRILRALDIRAASSVTPVMGPPNRAPGIGIMGGPDRGRRVDVMGGPDRGPRLDVMGGPDPGPRLDVMGQSDSRFVDALFGRQTRA